MKPIKVCHLTPAYFSEESVVGGGERYVYNLVQAVKVAEVEANCGIDQSIISVSDSPRTLEQGGTVMHLLPNISRIPGNMNSIPGGLWDHLGQFDVVHIHQGLTQFGEYCAVVAASLQVPFVTTDLGGGSSNLMLSGKCLNLAERVLSISKYAQSLTRSSFSGKADVIIGPVDTDYFVPPAKRPVNDGYGICVSRVLPHKGIDRIISALPNGLNLKVVGKVHDQRYFELLEKLAKGKAVEFVQDADDDSLLALYQGANLFLQGSTHKDIYGNVVNKPELMGLTTLEAMSCGLPVVVSDAGSLPEMVPNRRVGRVFGDHQELLSILKDYMSGGWPDESAYSEARAYVVENFSFLSVGKLLARVYREVAEN